MADTHLYAELLVDMLGQMLGTVDGTVLTACATEREHQRREATLDIPLDMGVGQTIDAVEEGQDLAIVLEEADDRLVETSELLIGLVTTRVMGAAAIEHITTTIATLVLRNALAVAETINLDHQRALGLSPSPSL